MDVFSMNKFGFVVLQCFFFIILSCMYKQVWFILFYGFEKVPKHFKGNVPTHAAYWAYMESGISQRYGIK